MGRQELRHFRQRVRVEPVSERRRVRGRAEQIHLQLSSRVRIEDVHQV